MTIAISLDRALAEYAHAAPLFDASTLQRAVEKYPEHSAPLLRYAVVQLLSVPASTAEIAASQPA